MEQTQITLSNLRFYAYHGVMPQERTVGGWYRLSLIIDYPFARALETDDVADTLNYAEVYNLVKEEIMIPSNLLEHVAGRIINRLQATFPSITAIDLHLVKENPPMGANTSGAGVRLSVKC